MTAQGQKPVVTTREGGLTETQQNVLNVVRSYIQTHGISPSTRDVMTACGLASPSTVQVHFRNLQRAGAIDLRKGVPRSVRVLWCPQSSGG